MVSMIGSSTVHGESHKAWKSATKKICKRAEISDYKRKDVFRLCQIGINSLDDLTKNCLLDLQLFPRDRKICADALLDIWVYVRNLQRQDAFAMLSELASRNLLYINSHSRVRAAISNGNTSDIYVSRRDFMQNLAINDRTFESKILSIRTGTTEENKCNDHINFPETEGLLLFFTSTEYVLPQFVKSMKKLKFVMVANCGRKKATVKGLHVLSSLNQLKCVRLERMISPSGHEKWMIEGVQKLEKVSLSLCEGFENTSIFDTSKIKYLNLDHSSHLEELPPEICNMTSALSLSITNCHLLQKLPHDIGNMRNVRMLKLSGLAWLKEVPQSIGELGQLEYLEISVCNGLKELPKEIGKLKKLKELDMRECSHLKTLPETVCELSSLEVVICDEKIEKQWLLARKISLTKLRIEIFEEHFNLDWLDD